MCGKVEINGGGVLFKHLKRYSLPQKFIIRLTYMKCLKKLWINSKLADTTTEVEMLVFRRRLSAEDEQSILFETSRPHQLFSESTLPQNRFTHVHVYYFSIVSSYFSTPCKSSSNTYMTCVFC